MKLIQLDNGCQMVSYEVLIHLTDGKKLPVADLISSDPFVTFKIGKEKKSSSMKIKTLNPIWNENFQFEIDSLNGNLDIEGTFN